MLQELGKGSFGTVLLAERRVPDCVPEKYALKRIDKRALSKPGLSLLSGGITALDKVYDEISIMENLYNRYCVLLFEVIDPPGACWCVCRVYWCAMECSLCAWLCKSSALL